MHPFTRSHRFTMPAAPAQVFPLLCPVREYEWLPHWRCELLHSAADDAWLADWSEAEQEKSMDFLRRALTHYLTTGERLRP
jgi:hypothetical protein